MEDVKPNTGVKSQSCGWASASLILGIIGLILCALVIPSLLAVIFGVIALVKIKESGGMLAGRGRAIAGIILGGLWIMVIPIAIIAAIAIPNLVSSRSSAKETHRVSLMEELKSGEGSGSIPDILSREPMSTSLMGSRISANEISAISSLKTILAAEALWLQQDADSNGVQDYWTYDVSGLYRMLRADGLTRCEFIPVDLANADASPADFTIFESGKISQRLSDKIIPKYGYLFEAMTTDETGGFYNQGLVDGIEASNKAKFAFVAYPEKYGITGTKIFIINESGTVYEIDPSSDQNKAIMQWPGVNPCEIPGPGGKLWKIAD